MPFDPSLIVYFHKRLTSVIIDEINEMVLRDTVKPDEKDNSDEDNDDKNNGTLIVDATCAPSNIRYPQDVSLLNEAQESAEKILDELHDPAGGNKPRTYRNAPEKSICNIHAAASIPPRKRDRPHASS